MSALKISRRTFNLQFQVYELGHLKNYGERVQMVQDWQDSGGILIIGYQMFRNLCKGSHIRSRKQKKIFYECLSEPGKFIHVL
jgi:transcriptional regulator ATRX